MSTGTRAARKGSSSGIVAFCLHGAATKAAAAAYAPSRLVEVLRDGLPVAELEALQVSLAVPIEKLIPMLGLSKATFHRRKAEGKFSPAESDRLVRFARLMGRATEVMESEERARQWLSSPQFGLGGAVPLHFAETEVGAREVEDLLGRIEHGVYS